MKKILLFIIFLNISIVVLAQNPIFEWVKSNQGYPGTVNSDFIQIDSTGNIFTIGEFTGMVDFNPDPSITTWLSANYTGNFWFIQKLDSSGQLAWVRAINIPQGKIESSSIDPIGNLYITGSFEDSVDSDPGPTTHYLYSNGERDAFILKLSSYGTFIWAKSIGGQEDDFIRDIVTDIHGNIYSHGSYKDSVDFDPGSGIYTLIAAANDAFVQKLDMNGNFIWVKTFQGSEGYTDGEVIDIDSQGNLYCSGNFFGTGIDFDPGLGVASPPSNSSLMYFVKLDSLGDFVWARFNTKIGVGGYAIPYAMAIDRFSNIFITGSTYGNIDFDPGPDTLLATNYTFIQKYDQNNNFLWAKFYGYDSDPTSLAIDTFGNIYTTGFFRDSTFLDPDFDTLVFYVHGPGTSGYGAYFQKLNSSGTLLMSGIIQANTGVSNWSIGGGISVNNKGDILATGDFGGTVDFDISTGVYNQTSINNSAASYTLKLNQCSTITTQNVIACDTFTWIDGITYTEPTQSAYFTLPAANGCDSVICLNLSMGVDTNLSISNFGGTITAIQNNASYQWLDCNNAYSMLPGDTLQSFTPSQNGNYAVTINYMGCVDTSACVTINNVSISEIEGNKILLYPNPNVGSFILDIGNIASAKVSIFNSMGQELLIMENTGSKEFNLDLNPGVYFAQIQTEKTRKTIKFVVK